MKKLVKKIKTKYYEAQMSRCQNRVRKSEDVPTANYWIDLYWDYNVKLLAL